MLTQARSYFSVYPPWLACLPFLIFYGVIAGLFADGALAGDESRHFAYARYLAGLTPFDDDLLWTGPGYGLFLAPFAWLGLGVFALTALNSLLHYGTVVALLSAGREGGRVSSLVVVAVLAWGMYLPAFQTVRTLYSEPLATLLLLAAGLSSRSLVPVRRTYGPFCRRQVEYWRVLATAALLAFLTLTKVIVAYALAASLISGAVWMAVRRSRRWLAPWTAGALALALTLLYLTFTQQRTGHFPVYALSGGSSLYPMTSGHPGETGSWIPRDFTLATSFTQGPEDRARITARWHADHRDTRAALGDATSLYAVDSVYRTRAWRQLRQRPTVYLRNVALNAARMLANWPFSHYRAHWLSLVFLASNGTLLYVAYLSLRRAGGTVAPDSIPLATLTAFALLGSLALAAYPRHLYVLWPALLSVATSVQPRGRDTQLAA